MILILKHLFFLLNLFICLYSNTWSTPAVQSVKLFLILENGVCRFPWNTLINNWKCSSVVVTHFLQVSFYYEKNITKYNKTFCFRSHLISSLWSHIKVYGGESMPLCTVRAPGFSKLKQGWTKFWKWQWKVCRCCFSSTLKKESVPLW